MPTLTIAVPASPWAVVRLDRGVRGAAIARFRIDLAQVALDVHGALKAAEELLADRLTRSRSIALEGKR
jgi:hypothetical protein